MDDTASDKSQVLTLARILEEYKAEDTVVLDVRGMSSWTDYFLICTVRSQIHMKGLVEHILEFIQARKIRPLNPVKNSSDQGWMLIDCGVFVVHLMVKEKREFYELEKLWFGSELLYKSEPRDQKSSNSMSSSSSTE